MEEQPHTPVSRRKRIVIFLLCLLLTGLLLAGLFVADRNTRALGFNLETHLLQSSGEEGEKLQATMYFMGTSITFDYTALYHAAHTIAGHVWFFLEQMSAAVEACMHALE